MSGIEMKSAKYFGGAKSETKQASVIVKHPYYGTKTKKELNDIQVSMNSYLPLQPESIKSKFLWLILKKLRILGFYF